MSAHLHVAILLPPSAKRRMPVAIRRKLVSVANYRERRRPRRQVSSLVVEVPEDQDENGRSHNEQDGHIFVDFV